MASSAGRESGFVAKFQNVSPMAKGFEQRKAGVEGIGQQLGGAAGMAGAVLGGAQDIAMGATKIATAKQQPIKAARAKQRAAGALDIAAGGAMMGGPIGMAIGAPLKLVSMLLNIKGPRQRRQEREAQARAEREQEFMAQAGARAAAAPVSAALGGGGAQMISNAPTAPTTQDFQALVPTGKLLGF